MTEEMNVKLLGLWSTAHTARVELALKLKGIPYEYFDEDIHNKSELLLKSNPVHKMVPVLIHNGIPIAESLIILEYIDDTWTHGPKLIPADPYKRAKARFWASFINLQVFNSMHPIAETEGEEQKKALNKFYENLKLLEDGMGDLFSVGCIPAAMNEKNVGLVDVVLHSVIGPFKAFEEALGLKLLDPDKNPLIFSWLNSLNELPSFNKLILYSERVAHLQEYRQIALKKA